MRVCIIGGGNHFLEVQAIDKILDDTIAKQCYFMLKSLDENKRYNWVTDIKGLLCRYGFNIVWYAQELGDPGLFLSMFKQRVQDCAQQEWHSDIMTSTKLECYAGIKHTLTIERYLVVIPFTHLRRALAQIRCSAHRLNIEQVFWKSREYLTFKVD